MLFDNFEISSQADTYIKIQKYLIVFFLGMICFVLPLQVYSIGTDIGMGLQTAFFRFQVTSYGSGYIFLYQDLGYVLSGTYTGKTAISVISWLIGDMLLLSGTCFALLIPDNHTRKYRAAAGPFIIASGTIFLFSCIAQYGILLHSSSGMSLPIGVLLELCVGWLLLNTMCTG